MVAVVVAGGACVLFIVNVLHISMFKIMTGFNYNNLISPVLH